MTFFKGVTNSTNVCFDCFGVSLLLMLLSGSVNKNDVRSFMVPSNRNNIYVAQDTRRNLSWNDHSNILLGNNRLLTLKKISISAVRTRHRYKLKRL